MNLHSRTIHKPIIKSIYLRNIQEINSEDMTSSNLGYYSAKNLMSIILEYSCSSSFINMMVLTVDYKLDYLVILGQIKPASVNKIAAIVLLNKYNILMPYLSYKFR